jgi:hypothetical protein
MSLRVGSLEFQIPNIAAEELAMRRRVVGRTQFGNSTNQQWLCGIAT